MDVQTLGCGLKQIQNNTTTTQANVKAGIKPDTMRIAKTPDSFTTNNPNLMKESMIKIADPLQRNQIYNGSINGSSSNIRVEQQGLFKSPKVQGNIGEKFLDMIQKNDGLKVNYEGQLGDSSFSINMKCRFLGFGAPMISGTINGKSFEIDLKNGEIPQDKDTQDIITTILMLNSKEAKVKNGHFNGTTFSDSLSRSITKDNKLY